MYFCKKKKLLRAFYSLLFFICLAAKPLYTLGYIGYYELNINYIVETYCVNKTKPTFKCNGKCHLSKKLALSVPQSITKNSHKKISSAISEAFVPVFFQIHNFTIHSIVVINSHKIDRYIYSKKYSAYLPIISPPPQHIG